MYSYTKINGKYYITDAVTKIVSEEYSDMSFDLISYVERYISRLNKIELDKQLKGQMKTVVLSNVQKFRK